MQRPSLLHYGSLVSLKSLFDKVHFDFWTRTSLILAHASKELQLPKTGLLQILLSLFPNNHTYPGGNQFYALL